MWKSVTFYMSDIKVLPDQIESEIVIVKCFMQKHCFLAALHHAPHFGNSLIKDKCQRASFWLDSILGKD